MNPLRVLVLIDSLEEPGGAERLAVTLATALPRERFEVTMAATRTAGGRLVDELEEAAVPWFALGRSGRLDLAPFRHLVSFMRRARIEVVHSHMFGSNLWTSLLAPLAGVEVRVAHEHGSPYEGSLGRLIRGCDHRLIGPVASAVVVGTDAERERVVEQGGVRADKVEVIPAPFVARGPAFVDLRAELGLADDTPLVGTAAWLRPEKALEVLVDAFAALPPACARAQLVIAGEGPARPGLEARADARGVRDRTHFLGARADVLAILDSLDVAALSSDRESTSLVALEAIAAGTPLVSTRVGGPAEFLADGESALLVQPRDPAAMTAAIASLLADAELRGRLAAAAGRVLDRFSVGRVAGMHAALYERLIAGAGRRPPASL